MSSKLIARWLETSPELVRRDLTFVGRGKPGAVWTMEELTRSLKSFLGLNQSVPAALVGLEEWVVNLVLGKGPLMNGLDIKVGFDSRTNRLETSNLDIPLFPSTEIPQRVAEYGLRAAILATSASNAARQLERLVLGGVKGVLNLTTAVLKPPKGVVLVNGGIQGMWCILAGRLAEMTEGENHEPGI